MNTHVIILAQGEQKRLPNLTMPKQMLRLPACGDVPILYRTFAQLSHLAPADAASRFEPSHFDGRGVFSVQVVTWLPLAEQIMFDDWHVHGKSTRRMSVGVNTLPEPGNSSLKGLSRYLTMHALTRPHAQYERTVVLLGDVVYSWACLRELFAERRCRFVGTSDLSEGGGELWGVSWMSGDETVDAEMHSALEGALTRHPPFRAFQPGQLRRWLWETPMAGGRTRDAQINSLLAEMADIGARALPWYAAIDDYTRDIDVPKHVDGLGALSLSAREDDAQNGLVW